MLLLMEARQKKGKSVKALSNVPDLLPHLEFVWEAYKELDLCRETSDYGVPQPLKLSEIQAWLGLNLIDSSFEKRTMTLQLLYMDLKHRSLMAEFSDTEKQKKPPKGKHRGRRNPRNN